MSHYFITGATGAIGSALVPILLAGEHDLSLLIRGSSDAEVEARLQELFKFWDLGWNDAGMRRRIQALRGDASSPRFGLDDPCYASLVERTNRIIHCAGAVRMNLPLQEARRSAVGSAREIMALGRAVRKAGHLEKIDIISTVGVGGRLPQVPEDWLTQPRAFHNTYEQAKAEAEDFIRNELNDGIPVTVHRPSMVVGNSLTGKIIHFQIFYHLCEFLSGKRTLGLSPPLEMGRVDIVPVDYVAQMIAWSSAQPTLEGKILHQCAGATGSVSLKQLQELVRTLMRKRGLKLPMVINLSAPAFHLLLNFAAFFLDKKSKRAIATLPVFLDYLASDQCFDNAKTVQLLPADAKWAQPSWGDYLSRVLEVYLDSRSR